MLNYSTVIRALGDDNRLRILMPGSAQSLQRRRKLFAFHQNVVRVIGGNGKNADALARQQARQLRQNAHKGKIQRSFNSKGLPAVFPRQGALRHGTGSAHQRNFLIRLADEQKITGKINLLYALHFADAKIFRQHLDGHEFLARSKGCVAART